MQNLERITSKRSFKHIHLEDTVEDSVFFQIQTIKQVLRKFEPYHNRPQQRTSND